VLGLVVDITGGPCRDYNYVLEQIYLHWGEDDSEGSEHLINANPFAAEVRYCIHVVVNSVAIQVFSGGAIGSATHLQFVGCGCDFRPGTVAY